MDNKKESILSGILKYSISSWVGIFIGFFSVIITTRLIAPDVYGIVMLFLSATHVALYIVTIGMDGACIRFYNEPPGGNTVNQLLYKNIVITTLICLVVGLLCTFVLPDSVTEYVFGFSSRLLVGMLFVFTLCQVVLRYLNISYRMSFKAKMYNIQNILINSSYRVLIILAALITNDSIFIITVLTLGLVVILLVYVYIQRREITPIDSTGVVNFSLSMKGYGEYMRYAIFNAPTYIVTYFNTFACQQIIRNHLSAYSLGIFSSTGAFSAILSVIKGGFSTFWSAYVYKEYTEEQDKIKKMHDFLVAFTIIVTSVLVCCRDIIYLAIGPDYHDSKRFFSLLLVMPILTFVEETTDKGVAIAKKSQVWTVTHLISVVVNIGLCMMLINGFELKGAAWANAISAILLYGLNTYYGQKYFRTIDNYFKSLCGIIVLILLLVIPSFTMNIWVIIAACFVLDIIAVVIYSKEYRFMLQRIMNSLIKKNKK